MTVQGSLASGQLQIDQLDWQLPAGAGRLRLWQLQIDGAGLVLWPRPGAQALLRLGCHLIQGHGIAHPMPAARMQRWMRAYATRH